ncbi:hypothetical protein ABID21_002204 [Pseudorhizobium tarimense]|uniref:Uncharacterized protein n=1 Tax=Pseudorhizobium tarimense TaxID=1079109 RepID=A0ABV2H6P3_9HYPH
MTASQQLSHLLVILFRRGIEGYSVNVVLRFVVLGPPLDVLSDPDT